ncbi:MAG: nitrous oxide reductase family maturation protein NosD [Candidatus Thorarchaeota archaeon]
MKTNFKIRLLAILGLWVLFIGVNSYQIDLNSSDNDNNNLKTATYWNLTGSPILIDDSNSSRDWAYTEANYDWCSGSGTIGDPYIIENVTIDGQYSTSCIEIRNSNVYFEIRNCTLYQGGYYLSLFDPDAGIRLDHVTNGVLANNNCSSNIYDGIYLFSSNDITVSGNTVTNNFKGIHLDYSDNNDISGNIIQNNIEYGIYIEWSDSNTLHDNNMTNCGIGFNGGDYAISANLVDTSNLVNQKPVYCYINSVGLTPSDFTNAGQVILISCTNALIEKINTSRGSCGIALHYSSGVLIRYVNSSYNTDRGIYLEESDGNVIHDCNTNYNGHGTTYNDRGGIVLVLSSRINISFNVANYNSKGISMVLGENTTLYNNTANYNTHCGVRLASKNTRMYLNRMKECGIEMQEYQSSYTIDTSNTVNNKPVYYYNGIDNLLPADFTNAGQIILVRCNNSLISEMDISHGSCGIHLSQCHDATISNINASYNTIYGLYLDWRSYNNYVLNSRFIDNLNSGIQIYGDNNLISTNIIKWNKVSPDAYAGIRVSGNFNNITANEISRNNLFGISLTDDNNVVLNNNIFNNSRYGIALSSNLNEIITNNITNNGISGIRIFASYNNITGNLIENNTAYGIEIFNDYSENNLIYTNLFINNGIQASDNSTPFSNFWDNGTIGNYWDDYKGADLDDDGIGDEPYNITGIAYSQDHFPIWEDGIDVDPFPPTIIILEPVPNQLFGTTAPAFTVEITDENLHIMWYTIDDGLNNYTFTSNESIYQPAWDLKSNGTVIIIFYANDTYGHRSSEKITVRKDIQVPEVSIIEPSMNDVFEFAPAYEISVVEGNLDMIWYTLNDGDKIFIGIELLGIINLDEWNKLPNGYITLRFYANDTLGNLNFDEIIIVKNVPTSGNGRVPGYDLFILIGIISISALILIQLKRRK